MYQIYRKKQTVTDSNDVPLHDMEKFYSEYNADLIQVQNDLNRFSAPAESKHRDIIWILIAVLSTTGIIVAVTLIYRHKKR